jgi:hypothetical protein
MSGGRVSGNKASGLGDGVFVPNAGVTFSMDGGAAVDANNDVYLETGIHITVSGSLTENPAAVITPAVYANTTQVLTGAAVAANYDKFSVTPDGLDPWHVDNTGRLAPGP